jgi:hypothetical protein
MKIDIDPDKYAKYKMLLRPIGVFALPPSDFTDHLLTHVLLILENTKPRTDD